MRIIAGKLKGTTLFLPKDKDTRPLKDLARESIFNLITHSNKILFKFEKSKILDLYSGIGSFGLECLSRQALSVYFVEKKRDAVQILEKNITKLKLKNKIKIFHNDIFDIIGNKNILSLKFDLIFCDPPFKDINISKLLELISNQNLLNEDGIIILHRHKLSKDKFDNNFKIIEERTYGISKIIFGKFSA
jgi:16S rRNA (guanine966-N2)-methyltransferase